MFKKCTYCEFDGHLDCMDCMPCPICHGKGKIEVAEEHEQAQLAENKSLE